MKNSLDVINPGTHTLIQDAGRYGKHQLGLTTGGPMDARSHSLANLLCHNPISASALEVTLGNLEIEFHADTWVAVTGADNQININGLPQALWQTLPIRFGDRLVLGFPHRGCRNYLAVAGGLIVEEVFGSTATVVREGIGGLDGRTLQQGDQLLLGNRPEGLKPFSIAASDRPTLPEQAELRLLQTCQTEQFTAGVREQFFTNTYSLGTRMDRMGYFLEGTPLDSPPDGIVSEGTCLGAVQITPDGLPIILMRDRPTIGGYSKIGTVLSCDLDVLVQMTAGQRVRFVPTSLTEAQSLLATRRRELRRYTQAAS